MNNPSIVHEQQSTKKISKPLPLIHTTNDSLITSEELSRLFQFYLTYDCNFKNKVFYEDE